MSTPATVNNDFTALSAHQAVLSEDSQKQLLKKVQTQMPATHFTSIAPSELPSLYVLKTEEGEAMYTEATGRYVYMGLILDLNKWKFLDNLLNGDADASYTSTGETE